MVKKIALLMVLAFTVLTLVQTANAGDRYVRLHGVIADVGHHGIVLKTDRGDVRIHVTRDTRILRNGERVRLHQLQVRDQARVLAKVVRRGDRRVLVALVIQARGR